jgi:hypothetical protein
MEGRTQAEGGQSPMEALKPSILRMANRGRAFRAAAPSVLATLTPALALLGPLGFLSGFLGLLTLGQGLTHGTLARFPLSPRNAHPIGVRGP